MPLSIKRKRAGLLGAFLGWGLLSGAVAGPVTIDYKLAALATPGRYEYSYVVTNVSLATPLSWFSIDFDTSTYDESSLLITSSGLSSWSEQILGSVSILGVPAQYDAFKMTGAPLGGGEVVSGFKVQFNWLGATAPAAQAFTVYDPSNLGVIATGLTTISAVPEPNTAALFLLGLCGALLTYRARQTEHLSELRQL